MASQAGQKRDRERIRLEKAAIKRARRQGKSGPETDTGGDEPASTAPPAELPSEAEILDQLANLHERFTNDEIDADEFQLQRDELLATLQSIT